MPFVTDSRFAGYLGPKAAPSPSPMEDEVWTDFLHDVVAGMTGLDPTLIRPSWQAEPPNMPDYGTDWVAIGITDTSADWQASVIHQATVDGYDAFQRHETTTFLCVFYGPHCTTNAALLRDGFSIDQNLAALRQNAIGLVEVSPFTRTAELLMTRWWDRTDVNVILRREVRRDYPVLNLLRAQGTITGNDPSVRTVQDNWDTGP